MWGLTAALGDGPPAMALAMVLGLLACYALGTAWFMAVFTRTLSSRCPRPDVFPEGVLAIAPTAPLDGTP